tara:strand:+ start:49 stop:513 length:465 start_codon:yes stop_codon:yes gene_type:complete
MKKLILLLSVLFVVSCSSENDETVKTEGNFLEIYSGVVWLEQNNDSRIYDWWHIFSPNGIIFGEYSFNNCSSEYTPWNVVVDEFKAEVIINSENTLKLKMYEIDDTLDWVSYTATFIVSNNINNPNNQVILTATYSDDPGYSELYSIASSPPCN